MDFTDSQVFTNVCIGDDSIEDMVSFAKDLGYTQIVVNCNYDGGDFREFLKKVSEVKVEGIDIVAGISIDAKDGNDLKQKISKVRDLFLVVIVRGGLYNVNRAACDDARVDILLNPHAGRIDNGLDEPCLRACRKNGIAIGVNFRPILKSYRRQRAFLLQNVATNLELCQAMKVRVVGCSGAQNKWELRDPRQLVSISDSFGLDLGRGYSSLTTTPREIIEKNRKILAGEAVRGVKVIGD
jgi:ribonuclease P/MRP protein subunit RPP1